MVTGRQKKRLIGSNSGSYSIQGQYSAKKKKDLESSNNLLNLKAHILLEWDDNQEKVVARKEQVGITWRNLGPFVSPFSYRKKGLADVISIPPEIFGLEDMTKVLSYEDYNIFVNVYSYMSKAGEFFLCDLCISVATYSRGASLCSGNLHPDVVLHQDQCFNANKNAYYFDLQKHHNEMLENLQKWKERWESYDDPENSIILKIWRNEILDSQRNQLAISDCRIVPSSARNEEKLLKLHCRSSDSAKYMSYIKITRKQHQLVKRMKQSSDGIKSKSLDRVLGDMKSYDVQPYEVYEEEECEKVQEHWTQLANKDIPSAFANWTERQLKRHQLRRELDLEISEKVTLDEMRGNPDVSVLEQRLKAEIFDYREADIDSENCLQDDETGPYDVQNPEIEQISSPNDHSKLEFMDKEVEEGPQDILKPDSTSLFPPKFLPVGRNMAGVGDAKFLSLSAKESIGHSVDSHPLKRIPSLNGHCELHDMDVELGDGGRGFLRVEGQSPIISGFVCDINQDAVEREALVSSVKDGEIRSSLLYMPDSFSHPPPVIPRYVAATASELSLAKKKNFKEQSPLLETDILKQKDEGALLHSTHDLRSAFRVERNGSFFGSFINQDHSKILQPYVKSQAMLPLPFNVLGHKQGGIQIPALGNGFVEAGNPERFREQHQMLVEQRQHMRERELYMHQYPITNRNMNFGGAAGARYPNQSHELLSSSNVQTWTTNLPYVSVPHQTHSNTRELVCRNSFPAENQGARGGWVGVDVSSASGQCSSNGSSGDGSLYSVLSQSSKLQPHPYSSNFMSSDQMSVSGRNFAGLGFSGGSEVFEGTSRQLNYLRGLRPESSGLNDPTARAFLRSWNQ
ncbi:hypothetical protein Sjap_023139 [Stephania japonica]|uniref:Nuclear factor related to kappa-B-binding protein n=1 Tax=Stephania japonica TaxID=461633 RepID=A0AAP0EE56_9MAGN